MNRHKNRQIILSLLFLLGFLPAHAQQGKLRGRVFDLNTNNNIAFANVIISGTTNGTITDENGTFSFSGLKPGFVRVEVSLLGYQNTLSSEIEISNAQTAQLEIGLERTNQQLEEIRVAASPYRTREESPLSLKTIGLSEIESSPGANRDISKVIQSFAGVQSTPSFRNDIIIRGGGPSESRFFLDGVEVPNINHFATQGASGGPVGIINADLLREVQYYSGAFPANRANALSGIFEFSLVDGNSDQFRGQAAVGAAEISATVSGPAGNKTSYVASVRRSYLQFLFGLLDMPFLPTFNDLQFKLKTRIDAQNELSIIGLGAYDFSKLNTDIENPDEQQQYILTQLPENTQWSYTIGAVYKRYNEHGYQTFVVSRNHLNNEAEKYRDNNDSSEANKTIDYRSQEAENKLRYENLIRTGGTKLNFGANADFVRYTNSTQQTRYYNDGPLRVDYTTELNFVKWGLFAQASQSFVNDRLSLSLGLRVDANNYSSRMRNAFEQFSPRFSASWKLTPAWAVNFNTGRYYQLPPYTALGYRQNNQYINKQNGLKYIRADHFIAGISYQPQANLFLSLEGFLKNYADYPFSVNDSISLANLGADFGVVGNEEVSSESEGKAHGAELQARYSEAGKFNFNLSYTFVRSEFADKNGTMIPSSWDSRHVLVLTSTKKMKRSWQIGARWRLVGGLPYTPWDMDRSSLVAAWDANNGPFLDTDRWNTKRFKAFHQLDLRIDKAYYWKTMTAKFYLDFQNFYNFKNENQDILLRQTDEAGNYRTTDNGTRYLLKRVKDDSGTILPTVGIILQF
ncbi:TonB-dependent receptor [Mangrovibacterium marinum]|uniref:Outer membrane receptor for ferrienterochelin and colicin n=1 Tax=Mangrovibacterium marinum TaxID=1639118 RepID=A0A2T5C2L4_9BACT|nr:TonB-dependent receptor [Mangrovibacterium marinum]PTN08966.1 outer membrane receptor for ferrienterochelin and colicin [Mangrovibacterium marinum]